MIELHGTGDYLVVIAIAGVSGLVGGLAAELLLNRDGVTGAFELPGRRKGGLLDLGGFSSMVVGVVAGVAILLVLPPQVSVSVVDGAATSAYEPLRLIATSLVAGSAGGSVLTALQARVTAAINAARVEFVRARGEDEVNRVRDVAKQQLEETVRSAAAEPAARSRGVGEAPPAAAARSVDEMLNAAAAAIDQAAEQGKRAVTGTARGEEQG